jgi:hypothetical protein
MPIRQRQNEGLRGFNAVEASRQWKITVAEQTEGMSIPERMAWFRRQSSVAAIRESGSKAAAEGLLREEPPAYGKKKR